MKKVAFLKSRFSFRGGLEKYTLRLAKAFIAAGCEVTLLTTENTKQHLEGIKIVPVAPTSKLTFYHLLRFDAGCKNWIKNNPQDIVFGLERTSSQTHYRAGSGVHKVFLDRRAVVENTLKKVSFSFNPLHKLLLHLEKKAFEDKHLKILFTNSEMVRGEILSHYDIDPKKVLTVHNGVEWKEWQKPFETSFEKRSEAPFHFLFIGNGYRRKGLSFFLEGLALLNLKDFKVSIVGKDKEIPYFQKLTQKLSLEKQVTFYGPQKEILPFYASADCLVIPSLYDPFANVTVEALAMGLFVVSSKYNGGKEILTSESGSVIDELTCPESVCSALKKALDHKKTFPLSEKIRLSIQSLDFSHQLNKIVAETLLS